MKPKLALAWFIVSLALVALLVVQSRTSSRQKLELEQARIQIEKTSQQERAVKSRTDDLERENRQLRGQIVAAEVEANSARMAYNAMLQTTNSPNRQGLAAGSASTAPQQQGGANMGSFFSNMLKDPEMRKAMEQQQRMGLDMVYGGLYKELKLTPDQEQKFKDTLIALQMTNVAQAGIMFDPAVTNRAALMEKLAQDRKDAEAKIKEVLGDEKFTTYQDYNQTISERMMLDQFTKQNTLTAEQSDQLLSIMREEKKNMQINMGNNALDPTKDWQRAFDSDAADKFFAQQEQVNERVMERASQILAPEQIEKFRPFLTNQLSMQRAGMKMARQMMGGQNPQPPPSPHPIK